MRGSSRHGASRSERAGARGAAPRGDGRSAWRDGSGSGRQQGVRPGSRDGRQAAAEPRRPAPPDAERLRALMDPVARAAGLDLESVRAAGAGRRMLLRVVVDADGGVDLDGIADISRELSAALDAAGIMGESPYTLEVSSPGVDRPLTEPRHWRRAAGRLVRVPLAASVPPSGPAGPGPVEGRVIAAGEDEVTLEIDGTQRTFSYRELGPGRVQVEFGRIADESGELDGGEPDGH